MKEPEWGDAYPLMAPGLLHSYHVVFVRLRGKMSDQEVLRAMGLVGLKVLDPVEQIQLVGPGHVFLARSSGWLHVAGDWMQTLDRALGDRQVLRDLSVSADVVELIIGDCDQSYKYSVWKDGELRRRRVVESPGFTDRVLTEDVGELLPNESPELLENAGGKVQAKVLEWLGIEVLRLPGEVLRYGVPS